MLWDQSVKGLQGILGCITAKILMLLVCLTTVSLQTCHRQPSLKGYENMQRWIVRLHCRILHELTDDVIIQHGLCHSSDLACRFMHLADKHQPTADGWHPAHARYHRHDFAKSASTSGSGHTLLVLYVWLTRCVLQKTRKTNRRLPEFYYNMPEQNWPGELIFPRKCTYDNASLMDCVFPPLFCWEWLIGMIQLAFASATMS